MYYSPSDETTHDGCVAKDQDTAMDTSGIFSLRFGANAALQPTLEELQRFLESSKEGSSEPHSKDLAPYGALLTQAAEFKTAGAGRPIRDRMLYTVLENSHFARLALKSVVEQYKFHVHSFSRLDFRKPSSFIKSAEEEISRLNPKKKDEAARIERMRAMIDERKKTLEGEKKKWLALADELNHIVEYVTTNLARIAKLCESSIGLLVAEQVDRKKEAALIEDIKTEFKERLRDSLHAGSITKDELDAAKEQVADLSKRTADLLRSDIFTLTQLYETVHEHMRKTVADLNAVSGEIAGKRHANFDDDLQYYRKMETVLVSLVSNCRFTVKAAEVGPELESNKLLVQKRKEIIDHLLDLLTPRSP